MADLTQIRRDLERHRPRYPDGCLKIATRYGLVFHLCDFAFSDVDVEKVRAAMERHARKMMERYGAQ